MDEQRKPNDVPQTDSEIQDLPGVEDANDAERIKGGVTRLPDVSKRPSPGGPVPIPYPNLG
jgi:hypothetical protein